MLVRCIVVVTPNRPNSLGLRNFPLKMMSEVGNDVETKTTKDTGFGVRHVLSKVFMKAKLQVTGNTTTQLYRYIYTHTHCV